MNRRETKVCPKDEDLVQAVTRGLDPKKKKTLSLHLENCSPCRRKFLLLIELRDRLKSRLKDNELFKDDFDRLRKQARPLLAELQIKRTFHPARKQLRSFPWVRVIIFGLISISAAIWLLWLRPPEPILRDSATPHIRLLGPAGKIVAPPAEFRWEMINGAKSYEFILIDENLNLIYTQRTTSPHLSLPESKRQVVKRAGKYVWLVEALDENEQKIASASSLFWVE